MEQIYSDNNLVLYCVPDEESYEEMERVANGHWRVFTGDMWKFYCMTRSQARSYAELMGGTHIGKARWNEQLKVNTYVEVERIEG